MAGRFGRRTPSHPNDRRGEVQLMTKDSMPSPPGASRPPVRRRWVLRVGNVRRENVEQQRRLPWMELADETLAIDRRPEDGAPLPDVAD
jgi:hypothetical protein